jgi:O-methyltransferase
MEIDALDTAAKVLHTFKTLGPSRFAVFCKQYLRGPNPIRLWETDDAFSRIFETVNDHTLVDRARCFMLYQCMQQTASIPGAVAEVGVYRGGTARLIAEVMGPGKALHLFDTFSGMPATTDDKDFHIAGDFADTSLQQVTRYLGGYPQVRLHPGFFPDTAAPVAAETFSMVHVDVDIYRSVLDCCSFFYPRTLRGGCLVFDDYGLVTCPGAKSAVDEFFVSRPEHPIYLPTGQCLVLKL